MTDNTTDIVVCRVYAACRNAAGEPDFTAVSVTCSPDDIDNGLHYAQAENFLEERGYEGPFVLFDENEAPDWLVQGVDGPPDRAA